MIGALIDTRTGDTITPAEYALLDDASRILYIRKKSAAGDLLPVEQKPLFDYMGVDNDDIR